MKSKHLVKPILLTSVLMLTSTVSQAHEVSSQATTTKVKFTGDTQFSGFCQAVVDDNVDILLNQAARVVGKIASSRRNVIKLMTSNAGVTCNGKSLIEFSEQKSANDVHVYLVAQR